MRTNNRLDALPAYWLTRLYVACSAFSTCCATLWEPAALTHRLISASGRPGWLLMVVMASLAACAIFDVVVNDLMPDRFKIGWAKQSRHLIYITLSMCSMLLTYVFVAGAGWWRPLMLPFLIDAFFGATVAFLDLFQRHRAPQ